jgi:hypothetical protein
MIDERSRRFAFSFRGAITRKVRHGRGAYSTIARIVLFSQSIPTSLLSAISGLTSSIRP